MRKGKDFKNLLGENQATKILQSFRKNKFSLMYMSEKALAPFFGYSDLNKYYDDTQSVNRLHKIKVRTFFLDAIDDPTINPELYPYLEYLLLEFTENLNILGGFTRRGGHCGHFTGALIPKQWFTGVYCHFLDFIENKTKQ